MGRCFLVHGAFDPHAGRDLINRFGEQLVHRGWTPEYFAYESSAFVWAPWVLSSLASSLATRVRPGDVVIAQCFGATITYEALMRGAPFARAVLINPNLDRDTVFPPGLLQRVFVWYVQGDAVLIGGSLMPFSPMGQMGRVGYTGNDPRVSSFAMDVPPEMRKHTALFDDPRLFVHYTPRIIQQAIDALEPQPFIHSDSDPVA